MTFWLLGSLASTTVADLVPLAFPVVIGTAVLVRATLAHERHVAAGGRGAPRSGSPPARCASLSWWAATLKTPRRAWRPAASSAGSGWWCRIWRAPWSGPTFRGCCPRPRCSAAAYLLFYRHAGAVVAAPVERSQLGILSRGSSARRSSSGCSPACSGPGRDARGSRPWPSGYRWDRRGSERAPSMSASDKGEVLGAARPQWQRQDHAAQDAARHPAARWPARP